MEKENQNSKKKIAILFAGPVGSSKSPIANYLSYKLNFPVFSNDAIRSEVWADMLEMDKVEYQKRKLERLQEILQSGISFIYDASIDRRWNELKPMLEEANYLPIIISLDFSKEKLAKIYKAKNFSGTEILDRTFEEHQEFVRNYKKDISVSIGNPQFPDRLNVTLNAVKSLL